MKKPHFNVLLIEDDEDDFIITRDLLLSVPNVNYTVHWISHYDTGLDSLCSGRYDVCLLDYVLGVHNGLDLLRESLKMGCGVVPVILLTAHGGYEIDVEAMEAGASDYLVKGEFTSSLLERSIRYAVERKSAEEELYKYQHHLEELVEARTSELERLVTELQDALASVKTLRGLLPICAWCKKIRDDQGYWKLLETYINEHSDASVTHGICPECAKRISKDFLEGNREE